jgi:hypothetical protein
MIDAATSILGNRMQLQKDEISVSIMKKRLQAEQTMAQVIVKAAKNVEQIVNNSSGTEGSVVDIYI